MRAMVTPKFGGSELFEERDDVERPPPGPGQVMVRVLATADTDNQQSLKALGVDIAKDYTRDDVLETAFDDTAGMGIDAVFDTVGGEIVVNSIRRRGATDASPPSSAGGGTSFPSTRRTRSSTASSPRERARLDEMSRLIKRGQTKPLGDEALTLDEVRKAYERL